MKVEELFRFPEEREWEDALRARPKEELLAMLDRLAGTFRQPETGALQTQVRVTLAEMQEETERFLRVWRARLDVFGDVPDHDAFYRAFCSLQQGLEEGACRLRALSAEATGDASRLSPREGWAVSQLARGLVADAEVTGAAQAAERQRELLKQEDAARCGLQTLLRGLLQTALPAYADRALEFLDAKRRGKSLQAGTLCALTAEFAAAIGECKKRLDEMCKM